MSIVLWLIFAIVGFIAVILFLTENYYRCDNPFDKVKHYRRFHYDRHAFKDDVN